MSFLTEYFDEFRKHPIKKQQACLPEQRWLKIEGEWLDPKKGNKDKEWTDEEIEEFIKKTMRSIRSQSTYFREYCAHLDQGFKTSKLRPRAHPRCPFKSAGPKPDRTECEDHGAPVAKLALKDTEVMKIAGQLYSRDLDAPTLRPLDSQMRIFGYVRKRLLHTGLTEYQAGIGRLAYELVRDSRIPKYVASNGARPRWGYPPEEERQPLLDGAPFDGERLY